MLEVKGIGEMKLARYGEEFLACLTEKQMTENERKRHSS